MKRSRFLTIFAAVALGGDFVYGQLINGSMVGRVTDPSGGAVPDAMVTVKNMDTGGESYAKTDASGTYSVVNLPPGKYQITTEKVGFQAFRVTGLQLAAQQTVRQDIPLEVGAVSQSVHVDGVTPLVRTDTPSVGGSLNSQQISDLPLFMQSIDTLTGLTPGAQNAVKEFPLTSGARYWGGSYFTLNGLSEVDVGNGRGATSVIGLENQPPISSLQEFKVESVNATAEYRSSNTIMLVTKAGSNKFHGEAYEYLQNTSLNANAFLLNAGGNPRAPLHWNQFGANLGGPVVRNKAFFFVNYSGFRRRLSQVAQLVFPSMAMRQGDFSALCPAYDSNGACLNGTQLYNPFTGQPFPNNRIPSSLITSQAQALLKYLPATTNPSSPGLPFGSPNYIGVVPLSYDRNAVDARGDYRISPSDGIYVVYSISTSPVANTFINAPPTYGNGYNFADQTYSYSAGETHVFSPRTISELRLGYFSIISYRDGQNADFDPRSLFPQLTASQNRGLPTMSITGYTGMFTDRGSSGNHNYRATINLVENLTHVRGRHTIKAGVDISRHRQYFNAGNAAPLGSFSFNGQWTAGRGWPNISASQGNAFADFLLGVATSSATGLLAVAANRSNWDSEFYVQDTWQAAPRLTVYSGLRYMYQAPWDFADNLRTTLDLQNNKLVLPQDSATPTLPRYGASAALFAAYPYETTGSLGLPVQYIMPDKNNWGPRLGFAYRLSQGSAGVTVARGGYGVFYNAIPAGLASPETSNPPWGGTSQTYVSQLSGKPSSPFPPDITFQNPFPSSLSTVGVSANPTVFLVQRDLKNAVIQQWSLSLEHQFGSDWMVRSSYVGSQTHHVVWLNSEINVPAVQVPNRPIQAQRPWQPWGSILSVRSGGKQNFGQLQLEMIKRLSRGFTAQIEYQWTRSLDNAPVVGGPQHWLRPALDYGNTELVRRHLLVLDYIYELPFGRGRRWLTVLPEALQIALGGWQISGITTYGTGQPFSVNFSVPSSYVGWWGGRADLVAGSPLYAGQQSGSHDVIKGVQWFNPAAFTAPQPWTWGNSARNLLFGPGYTNWDINVTKTFRVPKLEGHRMQLRADFLDAFNHFNLGNPQATAAATQFGGSPITTTGKVYGGSGSRVIQVGLRYQF